MFIAYWDLPALAALWSAAAIATGALMIANELRSKEVARVALAASMERTLRIGELGSAQDIDQLRRNVATFAEVVVRVRAVGPGRIKDRYLDRSLDHLYELLAIQSEAAHNAEDTWELELSPEIGGEFAASWDRLSSLSLQGASPGPRFAMDFARAALEELTRTRAELSSPSPEPDESARTIMDSPSRPARTVFEKMTHLALRNLGTPSALAKCDLIAQLPRTLETARRAMEPTTPQERMTPLDQARLLRAVIVSAIEKFSSTGGSGRVGPEALQYVILKERYVEKRPISATMTRHGVPEATFHRKRRDGIDALAAELAAQEENLTREKSASSRS